MEESRALDKIHESARRIVVATEERTRVEHCRLEEFKKLLEQIGIIYDKVSELLEMVMEQEQEQTGIRRIHGRLDKINDRVSDLAERISAIETSRGYQDKTMDKTESRHYDFLFRFLPILGGLMGAGGGIMAIMK